MPAEYTTVSNITLDAKATDPALMRSSCKAISLILTPPIIILSKIIIKISIRPGINDIFQQKISLSPISYENITLMCLLLLSYTQSPIICRSVFILQDGSKNFSENKKRRTLPKCTPFSYNILLSFCNVI